MLTDTHIRRFNDDGFLLLPGAVSETLRTQVVARMLDIRGGRCEVGYYKPDGQNAPVFNSHLHDPLMWSLTTQTALVDALRGLLGGEPAVCQSMFFWGSSLTRPHQDEFYMVPKPGPLIGMWVAMQDVTMEDGPMCVIPGSHRGSIIRRRANDPDWWSDRAAWQAYFDRIAAVIDSSAMIAVTLRAGDVVFFHGGLVHSGAPPATPGRPRLSYVSHHHRADAVMDDSNNSVKVESRAM